MHYNFYTLYKLVTVPVINKALYNYSASQTTGDNTIDDEDGSAISTTACIFSSTAWYTCNAF